jgi:nucleoid-associated protein YgaU
MKRIYFLLTSAMLLSTSVARPEDAATEERINQLNGKIEDLIAGQEAQRKLISELRKEIESLREQQSKPTGNYAGQEDLKRLAESVKEVDRKRMEDNEKTRSDLRAELLKIGDAVKALGSGKKNQTRSQSTEIEPPKRDEKGFEYTIKSGDTLSTIVKAYKEQNIKITTDQILKANPGLQPEKMKVGQKIFIPAPQ